MTDTQFVLPGGDHLAQCIDSAVNLFFTYPERTPPRTEVFQFLAAQTRWELPPHNELVKMVDESIARQGFAVQ